MGESRDGEILVVPARPPVATLQNRLVAARVRLVNGDYVWALIGNVDPDSARITEHFLTLSIEREGRWFRLARYHDFDCAERGPEALSRFLDLPVSAVFPIEYDIRRFVKTWSPALAGAVLAEPRERLTRAELIALAVP